MVAYLSGVGGCVDGLNRSMCFRRQAKVLYLSLSPPPLFTSASHPAAGITGHLTFSMMFGHLFNVLRREATFIF